MSKKQQELFPDLPKPVIVKVPIREHLAVKVIELPSNTTEEHILIEAMHQMGYNHIHYDWARAEIL